MALTKLFGCFLKSLPNHTSQSRLLTVCARLHKNVESSELHETSLDIDSEPEEVSRALETPLMTSRTLRFPVTHTYPRLAWIESMGTVEGTKLGMLDLHPDVFAVYPRIDQLHKNVHWQKMYRHISYSFEPTRAEMPGGGRKPWPQKGLGKARHGSVRSPLFIKGSKAHGPRGPISYFYMLPKAERALGLKTALSCKYAQNDLVIVDSLDIPTSDPEYMKELADVRFWGYSVLFVDDTDIMPENITTSLSEIRGFNLMPVYGLNVFSMLKHETLVLTIAAVEKIERKLLDLQHSIENETKFVNRFRPEDFQKHPKEDTLMLKEFSAPLEAENL